MTGKGDRWGRTARQVCTRLSGCQHDCTPPRLTARQEAGRRRQQLLFLLQGRPPAGCLFLQGLCRTESPLAVSACSACSAGFVASCPFCLPCPLPSSTSCPIQVCFAPVQFALFALFMSMCARIVVSNQHVCKLQDCPVGSCNTGLQWRPVRRVHLTHLFLFPAESMILGHGYSVNL